MKNIAVITARSGSKGLKDKNIKSLNGKPLIAYSIEAALGSQLFDEVYVSTDSEKYAEIAREYGASVPFLRDAVNASDVASSWDAVEEALEQYQKIGRTFETVCLLQPTSPLRTAEDIKKGYALFEEKNARAVLAVAETEHSPLWCGTLPKDRNLDQFISDETLSVPRQQLPVYYRINGALYILRTGAVCSEPELYQKDCYAYIMERERSVDIDTELDFLIAETVMRHNLQSK